jgi:hypothetical protein
MALSAQERRIAWRAVLEQDASLAQSFSKPDLDAAVAAVDAWCDSVQASYVTALPAPFKATSNAQQKALLLAYVALKRTGVI